MSDAITSAAAFIGISVALVMGEGWEPADDWAALVASGVIFTNGTLMLKGAIFDLMDRSPDAAMIDRVREVASQVDGVRAIEKLAVRRAGMHFFVDIHVQALGDLPLRESHSLGGRVKSAIRGAVKGIGGVLVHMEPFQE